MAEYEENPAIIYVLDSAFCLTYCNRAWDRFALDNGGADLLRGTYLGHSAIKATPLPLRPFYTAMYGHVLQSGVEADSVYECSSAETLRRFHMHVMRKDVPNDGPFLVVVNSLLLEEPRQSQGVAYDTRALREKNGFVTMCAHCRRTRLPHAADCWVWAPGLVRSMPLEVSHGICPVCFDIYYGNGFGGTTGSAQDAIPPRKASPESPDPPP
jgi:hypothetical protein